MYKELLVEKLTEKVAKQICNDYGIVDDKKRIFNPKHGYIYYYIDMDGDIYAKKYLNSYREQWSIISGNCFETKTEAESYLEYKKAIYKIKKYVSDSFGIFVPDWSDEMQYKWYIYFENELNEYDTSDADVNQNLLVLGYLETSYNAEDVIKNFKQELDIIRNYKDR